MKLVTLKTLQNPLCGREHWKDDGWVSQCSEPLHHEGPCVHTLYVRASNYATVTVRRAKPR